MGQARRGDHVGIVLVTIAGHPVHPMAASLAEAGVHVIPLSVAHRGYVRERREVARICHEFAPDVVHTHGYRADVVDRAAAARAGFPTVTTVHGPSFIGGLKGALYERLQRRNYRRYDAVVAVSRKLRDQTLAEGVRPERLHLIQNAWGGLIAPLPRADARRVLELPDDEPVVGWVGRFIPVKAGAVFLEAIARLPEPRPLIAMIGRGPEEEMLHERVARLGIADRVRFFPAVSDAGRTFSAFDAYVLSSRSEGLPIVVLEAMAARAPIVSTRVGGVPDMLIEEEEALLVPSDDPDALAGAIRRTLEKPDEARQRAARAYARLERDFSMEQWLERHADVYRTVQRGPTD